MTELLPPGLATDAGTHRSRAAARGAVGALPAGLALVGLVVGSGLGLALVRDRPVTWTSTTVLAIDQPRVVSEARDAGPIEKLSRLRLQYAGLARTDTIAAPVAMRTGRTAAYVASALSVTAPPDSLLLLVGATADSAAIADALSSAAADQMIRFATVNQARVGVPVEQRVVLAVATAAAPASANESRRTEATVALFVGLALAAAAYAGASSVRWLRSR